MQDVLIEQALMRVAMLAPGLSELLETVSHGLLEFYHNPQTWQVSRKQDQSLLTDADLWAHQQLVAGLTGLSPDIPVMSEETAARDVQRFCVQPPQMYWLIDPLDGTRGFVSRSGEFAINVALIVQTQAIAGWIAWPCTGWLCWAYGHRRFTQGQRHFVVRNMSPLPFGSLFDSLSSSSAQESLEAVVLSSSEGTARHLPVIDVFRDCFEIVHIHNLGAATKFCAMALGYGNFYPRLAGTCLWDLAAGQVLLNGLGGDIFDLTGQSLRYDFSKGTLNPHFLAVRDQQHPQLQPLLAQLNHLSQHPSWSH